MNSLFQQLQQPQQQANLTLSQPSLRNNVLQDLLKSSNPMDFLQKLAKNNPKAQSAMQLFQNSGMTPKQFFYQFAQQQGINPEEFINSLK